MKEPAEIIHEIQHAFPLGKPPRRPITGHRCDECNEVDQLMGSRTWRDVADDFPQYCHDAFPLLNEEAQVYYVPAYMCFELTSPGWMAGLSVASAFESGELSLGQFDEPQRTAIAHWMAWYHGS